MCVCLCLYDIFINPSANPFCLIGLSYNLFPWSGVTQPTPCSNLPQQVVPLSHLTSVFMALLFGLTSSTLIFIFEIAWTSSLPRSPETPTSDRAVPTDRRPMRSQAKIEITETEGRTVPSGLPRRLVTATHGLVRSWLARTSSMPSEGPFSVTQETRNLRRQRIILVPIRGGVNSSEQVFRDGPFPEDFEKPGDPKPQQSNPEDGLSNEASKNLE